MNVKLINALDIFQTIHCLRPMYGDRHKITIIFFIMSPLRYMTNWSNLIKNKSNYDYHFYKKPKV